MTKFVSRIYNRFEKNEIRGTVTKFSKELKLKEESEYYAALPSDVSVFFPRIIRSGFQHTSGEHFLEMEYYPYSNLGDLLILKTDFSKYTMSYVVARHVYNILQEFSKHKPDLPVDNADMTAMYITKTEVEQKKLIEQNKNTLTSFFYSFSLNDNVVINGQEYENFHVIWPKVKKNFKTWLTVGGGYGESLIHGDLCFANILCNQDESDYTNTIKLIDPRGKFGKHKIYGDLHYDVAKLYHSTNTGYELIINDKFTIKDPTFQPFGDDDFNRRITFDCHPEFLKNKAKVHEDFKNEIYCHYDERKLKLIEGILYISMAARHYDSLNRQKIMYASGIKLLNEVYNESINCKDDY